VSVRSTVAALGAALLLGGCGGTSSDAGPATQPGPPDAPELDFEVEGWQTDFAKHTVPLREIFSGGQPKDGIPAIDRPRFVSVEQAEGFLEAREPVIELTVAGETRAYPIQVLIWHEIVNDTVGGVPVAVTFCPLCNTAIVFDRRVEGRTLTFGTTGKLRNSDLVMYDRQTESWWQQFGGEGIVGRYAGAELRPLAARIVSWRELARERPDARVLSRDTGHDRPYGRNPYEGYDDVASPPIFPAKHADDTRLAPKERVVLLEHRGERVVVPHTALRKRKVLRITVGGDPVVVRWRPGVASALDSPVIASGRDVGATEVLVGGRPIPFHEPFWFAVAAFLPDVTIVR
jgi:hypothetical protein